MLSPQLLQALSRQQKRLVFLAETEPNLLCAECRIAVETRAGHASDTDFANQMAREFNIVFETESADIGHDVIGAVGRESSKTCFFKFGQNQIAARAIVSLQLIVVSRRQRQSVRAR